MGWLMVDPTTTTHCISLWADRQSVSRIAVPGIHQHQNDEPRHSLTIMKLNVVLHHERYIKRVQRTEIMKRSAIQATMFCRMVVYKTAEPSSSPLCPELLPSSGPQGGTAVQDKLTIALMEI